ncbi:hypothetical protein RI367_005404 [Sorochytrium milnesiophthora]
MEELLTEAGDTHARADALNFESLSDFDLIHMLEELAKKNDYMALENQLFEMHLKRVTAHALSGAGGAAAAPGAVGLGSASPSGPAAAAEATAADPAQLQDAARRETTVGLVLPTNATDEASMIRRRKRGDKNKQNEAMATLTPEQKAEVATRELEELRDEIEHEKGEWGKVIDNLKAEMEEIDIRLAEVKKEMYEFKRDIVQAAMNERTGKVMTEKVLRYFEDKLRARDSTIEKIRLKNSTLKTHKNKLLLQLRQKEEMGEVLHAIDFDQLKIENHQYLAKIEERNAELLKLKMTSGNIAQTLNIYKKKLGALTAESEQLTSEIEQRKALLVKLAAEGELVVKERAKASALNKTLKQQFEEYRVPSVMEYVMVKARQEECEARLKSCRRKVDIAQKSLVRMQRIVQEATATAQPLHSHDYQIQLQQQQQQRTNSNMGSGKRVLSVDSHSKAPSPRPYSRSKPSTAAAQPI